MKQVLTLLFVLTGVVTWSQPAAAFDWGWIYPARKQIGIMYSSTIGAEDTFIEGDNFRWSTEEFAWGAAIMFQAAPKFMVQVEYNYIPYRFEYADGDNRNILGGVDPWNWAYWDELSRDWLSPVNNGWLDLDFISHRNTHSFLVGLNYMPVATGKVRPEIYGGMGTHFFIRKFYWIQDWQRVFPASDEYPEIVQAFKNKSHGDVKKRGTVLSLYVGAGLDLMFNDNVGVNVTARYHKRVKAHRYDHWTGVWAVRGGLVFYMR